MTAQTEALREKYQTKPFAIEAKIRGLKGDPWKEIKSGADPQWFDCCMYRKMKTL